MSFAWLSELRISWAYFGEGGLGALRSGRVVLRERMPRGTFLIAAGTVTVVIEDRRLNLSSHFGETMKSRKMLWIHTRSLNQ